MRTEKRPASAWSRSTRRVALLLVRARRVVVVQVVEEVDAAVELVEEAAADAEALVEELYRAHQRALEDVFEPSEARIRNGYPEKEDEVRKGATGGAGSAELVVESREQLVVRLWVVNLVSRAFRPRVNPRQGYSRSEAGKYVIGALRHVGTGPGSDNVAWIGLPSRQSTHQRVGSNQRPLGRLPRKLHFGLMHHPRPLSQRKRKVRKEVLKRNICYSSYL